MVTVRGVIAMIAAVALLTLALPGHQSANGAATRASASTGAAVRSLTSSLGVLRRPQTTADRNPVLIRELRHDYHESKYAALHVGLSGLPVVSLMRLAAVAPWGQRICVVPFLPPTAAQKRRLPSKWSGTATRTTVTRQIFAPSGNRITYFFGSGAAPAFIEGGRAIGNGAYDTKAYNHPRQVIMVVPDGVAKVAQWYPTGSIANHPKHPITPGSKPVIAAVHDNIAAFIAPRRFFERPHDFFPTRVSVRVTAIGPIGPKQAHPVSATPFGTATFIVH
jgi:hypothetical protein